MDANLTFRSIDLDESEELVVAGPHRMMSFQAVNRRAGEIFVHFYDAASVDSVTVGSTTPKLTYPLAQGGGCSISPPGGVRFNLGIVAAATTGIADAGAPGANECVLDVMYQP